MSDGRIGAPPQSGGHAAKGGRGAAASAGRDRVTVDLRGIGDAVRAAAAARGATIAAFAREALVEAIGPSLPGVAAALPGPASSRVVAKLHLRMTQEGAELLVSRARTVGLSYGEYVDRLVTGAPMPLPVAQRDADRAALRQSCDQLAVLAGDINALIRLLRQGQGVEAARRFGDRVQGLEAEVRRHLALASRWVAEQEGSR